MFVKNPEIFRKEPRRGRVGGMGRSLSFGRYRLDLDTNVLLRGAEPIAIGSRCVTLLRVLLDARGELVSKATLLRAGWSGLTVAESNLTVQIAALRRLLDDKLIATVPRSGYRFTGKITESNMAARTADKIAVAILPITNMGSDPKERYFGDGVTREVITALSRFADLSVIAANSSLRFRDRAVDAHEARSELGVQYIGTVAVQRAGQQVRISAQLIDTETRAHLWAERYDRHMRDVFSMQDEVAGQIAGYLSRMSREQSAKKLRRSRLRHCGPTTTTFAHLTIPACGTDRMQPPQNVCWRGRSSLLLDTALRMLL